MASIISKIVIVIFYIFLTTLISKIMQVPAGAANALISHPGVDQLAQSVRILTLGAFYYLRNMARPGGVVKEVAEQGG